MEAQRGEGALPGSLSTGRPPALGLNAISAVGTSGLVDHVARVAANWTDSKFSAYLTSRSVRAPSHVVNITARMSTSVLLLPASLMRLL